jgi:hypothetical protein
MTNAKKHSLRLLVMFIAAFFLALTLTSCSSSTTSTAKSASNVKKASTAQTYVFDESLSCSEHLTAAKRAHAIASLHDERYEHAKKYRVSNGSPFYSHGNVSHKEVKAEMDFHKEEAEKFSSVAKQHENAVSSLREPEVYTCLMTDY